MDRQDYSYDPKKVTVAVNGRIITGFSADGIISMAHNEDAILPAVGVQGDVAIAENANNSAVCTLTLMATSASIAYLRDLCTRKARLRLTISDVNDDDEIHVNTENCRIRKMPDMARGREVGSVSVAIYIPDLVYRTAV